MNVRQLLTLLLLAALWGGSFLFMRYAAPAFGPLPLIGLRVGIATLFLLPLLLWQGHGRLLLPNMGKLAVVGLFNTAIPFVLIAWAVLSITSGLASILNATTPIFTALIGALWLGNQLDKSRIMGLLIGFVGVLILTADKADFKTGGSGWAIVAMLAATACYGFATTYTKRHLSEMPSLVTTTGSQFSATVVLLPFTLLYFPTTMPSWQAWSAVIVLGIACTAISFVLFYRLVAQVGASSAVTVTFLIPVFGVWWGYWFLDETLNTAILIGGLVVTAGTAFATGILKLPR